MFLIITSCSTFLKIASLPEKNELNFWLQVIGKTTSIRLISLNHFAHFFGLNPGKPQKSLNNRRPEKTSRSAYGIQKMLIPLR